MSTTRDGGDRLPRLYRDIADWYPLLTPVGGYEAAAAFYLRLFRSHGSRPPRSLLDLGSGGGHNAFHLKTTLGCTLVDLSPAMLEVGPDDLNPDCEHTQGDMRSVRLGRAFDAVLVHDAVGYMASRADLDAAIRTAFEHTAPGGVALFQPDFVRETFEDRPETGGTNGGSRGLRYLEWRWRRRHDDETYFTDMVYLLRDEEGAVEAIHDRHVMGLFPRAAWLERIAGAGFRATAVPFEIGVKLGVAPEVFVGVRAEHRAETGPPAACGGLMHYVILGNGVAGMEAALALRARDGEARITLVSAEHDHFFSRPALMYVFAGQTSLRDTEPHDRGLYERMGFERSAGVSRARRGRPSARLRGRLAARVRQAAPGRGLEGPAGAVAGGGGARAALLRHAGRPRGPGRGSEERDDGGRPRRRADRRGGGRGPARSRPPRRAS